MASTNRPSVPRKNLLEHIYDWVNHCDLSQLDAIMLALFVLVCGCGTIGALFLMGHAQNWIHAHRHPPAPEVIAAPAMQYATTGVAAYPVVGRSGYSIGTAYTPRRANTFIGSGSSQLARSRYPGYAYQPQTALTTFANPVPMPTGNIASRFGQPRQESWQRFGNPPAQAQASNGFGY